MTAIAPYTDGVLQVVVTHVHPGENVRKIEVPASTIEMVQTKLGRFQKGHPKVLGTVQIMIGIVIILIGIVMATYGYGDAGTTTGVYFWGSVIYIAAGSLAIATDNKLNRCLVNATLIMNVFAPVSAGLGIIFYSIDTYIYALEQYGYGWSDAILVREEEDLKDDSKF